MNFSFLYADIQFDMPTYSETQQLKLLVVFSGTFIGNKILTFRYDFVAPRASLALC